VSHNLRILPINIFYRIKIVIYYRPQRNRDYVNSYQRKYRSAQKDVGRINGMSLKLACGLSGLYHGNLFVKTGIKVSGFGGEIR